MIVISLGGSLIVPDKIDFGFLNRFKSLILKQKQKVVVVCGGGRICREYQKVKASNEDLDWVGIMATRLNAELVRAIFGNNAYKKVLYDPKEKVKFKKILVAAGYKPGGWTTDYDAVLLAKTYKAKKVINLTDISYVCDKDPDRYKNAKHFKKLSWDEYKRIISDKWKPGINVPFDPVAAKTAQRLRLKVIITKGLKNLEKILKGKEFVGTSII